MFAIIYYNKIKLTLNLIELSVLSLSVVFRLASWNLIKLTVILHIVSCDADTLEVYTHTLVACEVVYGERSQMWSYNEALEDWLFSRTRP